MSARDLIDRKLREMRASLVEATGKLNPYVGKFFSDFIVAFDTPKGHYVWTTGGRFRLTRDNKEPLTFASAHEAALFIKSTAVPYLKGWGDMEPFIVESRRP